MLPNFGGRGGGVSSLSRRRGRVSGDAQLQPPAARGYRPRPAALAAIRRRSITSRRFVELGKLGAVARASEPRGEAGLGSRCTRRPWAFHGQSSGAFSRRRLRPWASHRRRGRPCPTMPRWCSFTSGLGGRAQGRVVLNPPQPSRQPAPARGTRSIFRPGRPGAQWRCRLFPQLSGSPAGSCCRCSPASTASSTPRRSTTYRIIPGARLRTSPPPILFGTDTFLAGYARAANPYDFYALPLYLRRRGAGCPRGDAQRRGRERFGKRIPRGLRRHRMRARHSAVNNTPIAFQGASGGMRLGAGVLPG